MSPLEKVLHHILHTPCICISKCLLWIKNHMMRLQICVVILELDVVTSSSNASCPDRCSLRNILSNALKPHSRACDLHRWDHHRGPAIFWNPVHDKTVLCRKKVLYKSETIKYVVYLYRKHVLVWSTQTNTVYVSSSNGSVILKYSIATYRRQKLE